MKFLGFDIFFVDQCYEWMNGGLSQGSALTVERKPWVNNTSKTCNFLKYTLVLIFYHHFECYLRLLKKKTKKFTIGGISLILLTSSCSTKNYIIFFWSRSFFLFIPLFKKYFKSLGTSITVYLRSISQKKYCCYSLFWI